MAPFNAWPVLFLTFPVLVWLIDGSGDGRWGGVAVAASTGWWFGFGYFVAGLYWIGYAFLVDAPTFGWLLPFAVIGLPAVLAIFTRRSASRSRDCCGRAARCAFSRLAVALTVAEWLRGHVLTGFPWNAFGYALTAPLALAQSASLVGIWGLTFIAVAVFASPATLDRRPRRNAAAVAAARARRRRAVGACRIRRVAAAPQRRPDLSTACICASCSRTCRRTSRFNYAAQGRKS